MADPINFNKARKAKALRDKAARAEENRVKFGRTKAQKRRDNSETSKASAHLDAHKRGDDTPPSSAE